MPSIDIADHFKRMCDSISVLMCSNKFDYKFCYAVNSIVDQSYSSFEFVIVANSLTDQKYNEMADFCRDKRIRLVRSDLVGLPGNLNLGLHYCTENLVCRMDADDISYPDRLKTLKNFMDGHLDVAICGSSYDVIDESGDTLYSVESIESNREIRRALYFKNPFCHPTVMFRKNIVLQYGGYADYKFAQDYDLWLRLSDDKTAIFANVPERLLGYRNAGAEARGAVVAYLFVVDAYFNKLVRTGNPIYLASCLYFTLKAIFKKTKSLF